MVKRCVAVNCGHSAQTGHSLHDFPKDEVIRKQWARFVSVKRADFKLRPNSKPSLCESHFSLECFDVKTRLMAEFGMKRKKTLVVGSIPTIHAPTKRPSTSTCQSEHDEDNSDNVTQSKRRRAVDKLEVSRVSHTHVHDVDLHDNKLLNDECINLTIGLARNDTTHRVCILPILGVQSHVLQYVPMLKLVKTGCDFWKLGVQNTPCTPGWLISANALNLTPF